MKYTSTFLWLSAALLSAAPADKTLNLSIYDTTSTSFLNRAFTVSGNNGKVLGISGGDWALVTASGSSSLTSTQIAYGDGSNVQTSEAAFAYNSTLNILSVDAIRLASAGVGLSTNGDGALVIDGLGNGFDESIKMDFDTYSNIVQTSSPLTGATIMDYLDMSLRVTDGGGNFATLGPSGITVHNSAWAGNYTLDFGGTDGANEEIASKEWVNAQGFGGSLTSTYVGYGSGANALTGESAFIYTAASDLLTVPNVYASTSIELGAASDTTLTRSAAGALAVEGVAVPTISSSSTLTNKRITQRVASLTDAATVTPASDSYDGGILTSLSQTTDFLNPTGTPTDFQRYTLRIKSTTARTITFTNGGSGTQYRFSTDMPAPTATSGSSLTDYMVFQWNAADSKWDCVGKNFGF